MREIRTSGSVGASRSNLRGDPTPPPQLRSILRKRQEAWDGEESEGGAIRADSEGIRVRHRDGKGGRPQAGRPPPDGAPGLGRRPAARAQAERARAAGGRTAESLLEVTRFRRRCWEK